MHNIGGVGCNYRFNNLFFDVWCVISMNIVQHTNTLAIVLTDYGVRLLMELGFCWPIKFDTVTYLLCFGYDQTFLQMVKVGALAKS
jgi:hypothetical protein